MSELPSKCVKFEAGITLEFKRALTVNLSEESLPIALFPPTVKSPLILAKPAIVVFPNPAVLETVEDQ